ncbi:hypothetical protein [Pseudalkalibacillus berkeleyi]|uniref:Uncharacterized protein n=1 Tax=Pseudalkalibacillus berkeleyi TaxID=1069813 RepID=A0ABS9H2N2_9BACL|nr:hypothetical protein [Pseudalkalibacillus berkeleyi]MCF6137905.1 hypothetical protein [Pseudalkalibacillus berkeleyi]
MKRKQYMFAILVIITSLFLFFYFNHSSDVKESIIYFPIDPKIFFEKTDTVLNVPKKHDEDEYTIQWDVESTLGKKAYLRQDISLLFEDGMLKETLSKWGENTNQILQEKTINNEDSGHFEAISFHHAELHYPNDVIRSAQSMSYDQLYVIDSPLKPLESFKDPETEEDKINKKILDHATNQQLKVIWHNLIKYFNVPVDNYYMIPLTKIYDYSYIPLPGLTKEKTDQIIGGLWEGIYKNYFLGIKNDKGEIEPPNGSSLPLILLSKDMTHLLFLTETKSGSNIQLVQYLNQ